MILIVNNKVLLVKAGPKSRQLNGQLSFPGGDTNLNETDEQAAQRELTEETGLTAQNLAVFPGNYVEARIERKTGWVDYSFRVFIATEFIGELRATEETEPFWADIEEARKMKLYGKNNQILEAAIKFLEGKK
ncbi:MAG: NUDIX hydrolase [Candidatus Doudnabacteria bacterium]|nr:NUDIX hydrolase [Candidatus Doudnabacteria bacterium]